MTIGETIRKAIKEVSDGFLDLIGPKDFKLTDDEVSDDLKYGMTPVKPKRARTAKGRYRGDDLSTAFTNEAWVGGKEQQTKIDNRDNLMKGMLKNRYDDLMKE